MALTLKSLYLNKADEIYARKDYVNFTKKCTIENNASMMLVIRETVYFKSDM